MWPKGQAAAYRMEKWEKFFSTLISHRIQIHEDFKKLDINKPNYLIKNRIEIKTQNSPKSNLN